MIQPVVKAGAKSSEYNPDRTQRQQWEARIEGKVDRFFFDIQRIVHGK